MDTIAKIYCINLPESVARRKYMEGEFDKLHLSNKVEFVSAEKPNAQLVMSSIKRPGQLGCTMSHLKALGYALTDTNPGHYVFLEDDIVITPKFVQSVNIALSTVPQDWAILYLGGQPSQRVESVVPNNRIYTAQNFRGSYGYIVNRDHVLKLHNFIIDSVTSAYQAPTAAYDYILGKFSEHNNGYAAFPLIVSPVPGAVSIIGGGPRDYTKLINQLWRSHAVPYQHR